MFKTALVHWYPNDDPCLRASGATVSVFMNKQLRSTSGKTLCFLKAVHFCTRQRKYSTGIDYRWSKCIWSLKPPQRPSNKCTFSADFFFYRSISAKSLSFSFVSSKSNRESKKFAHAGRTDTFWDIPGTKYMREENEKYFETQVFISEESLGV